VEREPDLSLFSAEEIATMRSVATALGALSSEQLARLSHEEPAWSETPAKEMISYSWARELKGLES